MIPISVELMLLAYVTATGFVAAGLVSSFYQLVTAEPARFALLGQTMLGWLLTFLFCAVTGPFIIVRNAIEGRRTAKQPLVLLFGSLLVAALWSSCSGVLMLDFALAAQTSLG